MYRLCVCVCVCVCVCICMILGHRTADRSIFRARPVLLEKEEEEEAVTNAVKEEISELDRATELGEAEEEEEEDIFKANTLNEGDFERDREEARKRNESQCCCAGLPMIPPSLREMQLMCVCVCVFACVYHTYMHACMHKCTLRCRDFKTG